MLNLQDNIVRARIQKNLNKGTVILDSGSLVIENRWINYKGTTFNLNRYISDKIDNSSRERFFQNRNYALHIVLSIDSSGSLKIVEGIQVLFSTKQSVPIPKTFETIPLLSILVIQDGSSDMNQGFKPLTNNSLTFFSGAGNVLEKNLKGKANTNRGLTGYIGPQGITGLVGANGITGIRGEQGLTGQPGVNKKGVQGPQGITGINWSIHIPFRSFF